MWVEEVSAKLEANCSLLRCSTTAKSIQVASFPWGYLSAQRPPRTLLTHSDSGQQPFGHIGHNDANQEDDSIQPAVAQDKRE